MPLAGKRVKFIRKKKQVKIQVHDLKTLHRWSSSPWIICITGLFNPRGNLPTNLLWMISWFKRKPRSPCDSKARLEWIYKKDHCLPKKKNIEKRGRFSVQGANVSPNCISSCYLCIKLLKSRGCLLYFNRKTIFPITFVTNEMFCTQTVSLLSMRQLSEYISSFDSVCR